MKKSITWYENPTRKTLYIFGVLWLIMTTLLILAASDLFSESIFKAENTIILLLWLLATGTISRLFSRYSRQKSGAA